MIDNDASRRHGDPPATLPKRQMLGLDAFERAVRPRQIEKLALALLVGVTCAVFYLLFWSGRQYSIDGVVMFQYAKALVFQHSFTMDPPVLWGGDITVSRWPIGLTLAYVPVLKLLAQTAFAGDATFRQIPYDPNIPYNAELLFNKPYMYVSFVNVVITAATAAFLLLLALELGLSRRKACAIALVFGLAAPAATYSKYDFAQPLASLCLLAAFLLLAAHSNSGRKRYLVLSGVCVGLAIITRFEMLLLVVPFFIVCILAIEPWPSGSRRMRGLPTKALACFCLPVIVSVLANQYFNYLRFGSWLADGYSNPGDQFLFEPQWVALALVGQLISPGRGLLVFFPFAFLAFFGIAHAIRRPLTATMLYSCLAALLFYSTWAQWPAGLSWGPRFLIPWLPYVVLLSFIGMARVQPALGRWLHVIAVGLLSIGAVFSLQGLIFNFLTTYGTLTLPEGIPSDIVEHGGGHFVLSYSPIFNGWGELTRPENYDLFWLHQSMTGGGHGRLVLVVLLGVLAILAGHWIRFFRLSVDQQ